MPTDSLFLIVISILAIVISLVAIFLNYRVRRTLKKFFSETGHEEFGEVLLVHQRQLRRGQEGMKNLDLRLQNLETESNFLLNQVGLIKYNPFSDSGGNMSFSLAWLNNKGDGAIITSLHSREGTRIYSKTVKNFISDQQLTEEEEKAIKQAKTRGD